MQGAEVTERWGRAGVGVWRMQMCSGGEGRHDGRSTTSYAIVWGGQELSRERGMRVVHQALCTGHLTTGGDDGSASPRKQCSLSSNWAGVALLANMEPWKDEGQEDGSAG